MKTGFVPEISNISKENFISCTIVSNPPGNRKHSNCLVQESIDRRMYRYRSEIQPVLQNKPIGQFFFFINVNYAILNGTVSQEKFSN